MTLIFNSTERSAIATAFGNNSTLAAKLCDAVERADALITGLDQFIAIDVQDLAAGEDLTDFPLLQSSDPVTLDSIKLVPKAAFAGIDGSNTMVVTIKDGSNNVVVTKTYNDTEVPDDNDANDLGTLNSTHKNLSANETLYLNITNGPDADPPAMTVLLRFRVTP